MLEGAIKVLYDTQVDVIKIVLSNERIEESDEEETGFIFDYENNGNVVSIEILNASHRIENPRIFEYAVTV